jgi:outer membrane protein TolC
MPVEGAAMMHDGSSMRRRCCALGRGLLCLAALALGPAAAQDGPAAPTLSLERALGWAKAARAEMRVSRARLDAARERPAIVSALDDPVIAPSIDHKPVDPMMRTDRSITIEQSFPLSRVRTHRRRAAEADAERYAGEVDRTAVKIEAEVAQAYFMLDERRKVHEIVERQRALARQLIEVAVARHSAGAARQSDILRLEVEEARVRNRLAVSAAEARAAEAMFNAAVGRSAELPVPALETAALLERVAAAPDPREALQRARAQRPELRVAAAETRRARAEIDVMKSMYLPMAMVRVGKADTMTAGRGYMLMVGITVPIWRERLSAGVREASAMAAMAEADQEAMQRMVEGDVAASIATLRGALDSARAFRTELLPRAERTIAPAMAEYANGTLPLAAVLEAMKAWWMVQEEAVMADTALGMAWIRHRSALGAIGEGL